jgi:hypothetical protein
MLSFFKKTRRQDPIFGSMLYVGDRSKYWEAKVKFAPTGSEIEIFVDGSARDDMKQQHEFFKKLSEEWPSLREQVERILQVKSREMNPKSQRVENQFRLSSITIPKGSIDSAEWEISFSGAAGEHPFLYSVRMKGREPQLAVADD